MSPLLISDTLQVQSRGVEPRNREFLQDSAFFTSFSSAAFCASSWRDREVAFPTSIRPFFWKVLLSSIFFVRHVWPLRRLPQPSVVFLNALAYLCIGSRRKAGRPSLLRQGNAQGERCDRIIEAPEKEIAERARQRSTSCATNARASRSIFAWTPGCGCCFPDLGDFGRGSKKTYLHLAAGSLTLRSDFDHCQH